MRRPASIEHRTRRVVARAHLAVLVEQFRILPTWHSSAYRRQSRSRHSPNAVRSAPGCGCASDSGPGETDELPACEEPVTPGDRISVKTLVCATQASP